MDDIGNNNNQLFTWLDINRIFYITIIYRKYLLGEFHPLELVEQLQKRAYLCHLFSLLSLVDKGNVTYIHCITSLMCHVVKTYVDKLSWIPCQCYEH